MLFSKSFDLKKMRNDRLALTIKVLILTFQIQNLFEHISENQLLLSCKGQLI